MGNPRSENLNALFDPLFLLLLGLFGLGFFLFVCRGSLGFRLHGSLVLLRRLGRWTCRRGALQQFVPAERAVVPVRLDCRVALWALGKAFPKAILGRDVVDRRDNHGSRVVVRDAATLWAYAGRFHVHFRATILAV